MTLGVNLLSREGNSQTGLDHDGLDFSCRMLGHMRAYFQHLERRAQGTHGFLHLVIQAPVGRRRLRSILTLQL